MREVGIVRLQGDGEIIQWNAQSCERICRRIRQRLSGALAAYQALDSHHPRQNADTILTGVYTPEVATRHWEQSSFFDRAFYLNDRIFCAFQMNILLTHNKL
jgi:hypothetical protein